MKVIDNLESNQGIRAVFTFQLSVSTQSAYGAREIHPQAPKSYSNFLNFQFKKEPVKKPSFIKIMYFNYFNFLGEIPNSFIESIFLLKYPRKAKLCVF